MTQLESGQVSDLHALYGGLGSGRLIITGTPGAGKSGAAVLLILAALRYRDQAADEEKPKIPVPVLVTAQDWDPDTELVANWLARQLRTAYPLFSGPPGAATVDAMIATGRITVIIDGLDEIAEAARPVALQALSQQATFRLVLLSRTSEMASTISRRGILHGAAAIELQPVSPAEAVKYLERAQLDPLPEGWRDLTGHLRASPAGPLSRALDNPLALTLVRDTCPTGDDAREFLAFCTTLEEIPDALAIEDDITDYLLDRVLRVAYTRQPGQPPLPYDLPVAQNALAKIAARMNQENTRDLYWWHIPTWAPRTQRRLVGGLVAAFVSGLAIGLVSGLAIGLVSGLTTGLIVGLAIGLVSGLTTGLVVGLNSKGRDRPGRTTKLQLSKALNWENLILGVAFGLVFGSVAGAVAGARAGVALGSGLGIGLGIGYGLMDASDPDTNDRSLSPATSWRLDLNYALLVLLAVGLTFTVVFAVVFAVTFGIGIGVALGIGIGIGTGIGTGLMFALATSETWPVFLASAQMAIEWHIPVRLMRFLADAHSRNVLRTVGPAYQFRHARLQDRLAAAVSFRDDSVSRADKETHRLTALTLNTATALR